jgi:hypothetical protein
MNINDPVCFADGAQIFNKLKKTYIRHKQGRFILSSSGTGKTFYVKNQKVKHWIDGDFFWSITNADPLPDEWEYNFDHVMEVNNRCDVMTYQAKKQGLWILGSSNSWLKPDAIVILDEATQKKYILDRQNRDYDGGAKEEDFEAVKRHNKIIKKWAEEDVPVFASIHEAADHFLSLENPK